MSANPCAAVNRLVLVIPVLLTACGQGPDLIGDRAYDGLLERPDLQQIVDLQVERDGAALAALLLDEDPAVRSRAAFALGSVQDAEAVRGLLELLEDDDVAVRADAAFALGQTADSTAAGALLMALAGETDDRARRRMLEAIGKCGGRDALARVAALDLDALEEADRAMAIARFGLRGIHDEDAVDRLLMLLESENPETRSRAAYYFGRMADVGAWAEEAARVRLALDAMAEGDEAAMYLVQALGRLEDAVDTPRIIRRLGSSPDWRIRSNAGTALDGRTSEREVRDALFRALDDRSTLVAQVCAGALGGVRDLEPEEIEDLRNRVADAGEPWQVTGALLGLFGRAGEMDLIYTWLADHAAEDPGALSQGMGAVAQAQDDEAFQTLRGHALSEDTRMAAAAVEALNSRWRRDRSQPGSAESYYAIFQSALRGGDLASAYTAAGALADERFVPLGSVDLLLEVFGKMSAPRDVEPMTSILGSLGRIGDERAVPVLRAAMAHTTPAVAEAAAAAMARITGEEVGASSDNPPERRVDWERLAGYGSRPRLRLITERGTILVALDPGQAPQTCETILRFAEEGAYDGVPFHRVVTNFVIQGGDFERADGFGGPGFAIRSEFTRIPYRRGVIGMASGGKDTEGSQFFITHSPQPHLDGRYTAFGQVVRGMDVVDRIIQGDRVLTAEVVRGG